MQDRDDLLRLSTREVMDWKSVRIEVLCQQKQEEKPASDDPIVEIKSTYVETHKGERKYDCRLRTASGDTFSLLDYSDGKRCASLKYDSKPPHDSVNMVITRGFKNEERFGFADRPEPLCYSYVGLTPLPQALPGMVAAGDAVVIGRPCWVYRYSKTQSSKQAIEFLYTLDQKTSVPLRVECYRDSAAVAAHLPSWVWEADTLEVFDGRHVPSQSHYVMYKPKAGGARDELVPSLRKTFSIQSLRYDHDVPKTEFWPSPRPGLPVLDTIKNMSYEAPEALPSTAVVGSRQPEQPITADQPIDSSVSWMTVGVFALGAALLALAGVYRWKRG